MHFFEIIDQNDADVLAERTESLRLREHSPLGGRLLPLAFLAIVGAVSEYTSTISMPNELKIVPESAR